MNVRRRFLWRWAAVPVVAAVLVGAAASPAFAHADLEQTSPAAGQVLDQPPKKLTLGFNESVEVALGAIRVYNSKGDRLEIGDASHPSGQQSQVQVDVPKLDDDSYVVTWRVISADSHPVSGAFTFQVGKSAAAGNLQSLSQRLLANQGGDKLVGFLYAVARFGVFASLALLIGAAAFLVLVWPAGRESVGAARLVWAGWIGAVVTTVVGIALDGAYAAALPLGDAVEAERHLGRARHAFRTRLAATPRAARDRNPVHPAARESSAGRGVPTAEVVEARRSRGGGRAPPHARPQRPRGNR